MTKPLVYVAGPYAANPVHCTAGSVAVGMALWRQGFAVIVPHLTLLADLVCPMTPAEWYQFDFDQLAHCDALFRIAGDSVGADNEVAFACGNGIPVFHDETALMRWRDECWGNEP